MPFMYPKKWSDVYRTNRIIECFAENERQDQKIYLFNFLLVLGLKFNDLNPFPSLPTTHPLPLQFEVHFFGKN